MNRATIRATLVALGGALCHAQPAPPPNRPGAIEVSVEIRTGAEWRTVDPRTVFHSDDVIRFRFKSTDAGFLYVISASGEGETGSLFPQSGQTNRVEPGTSYAIPGGNGSFVVGGKPGYDTVYWIVSPAALDLKPDRKIQPSTLEPRCREEVLKARGLCMDDRAGPGPVADDRKTPFEWKDSGGRLAARDLKFQPEAGGTRITAPGIGSAILIYQFVLAHR